MTWPPVKSAPAKLTWLPVNSARLKVTRLSLLIDHEPSDCL